MKRAKPPRERDALRGRTEARRRAIVTAIVKWFDANARELPWRASRKPEDATAYRALVAEVMLQQTQVARVVGAYKRFLVTFPTVNHLAQAHEQDVLAQWQGLGYYRRARNLHAAAKAIVSGHGGRFPRDVPTLRSLPGVGRYTAGAIASIVFHQAEPIVDGNVRRVLARVHGRRTSGVQLEKWAWREAEVLATIADRRCASFNEGLMELGAITCLPAPARPRCESCPVARHCRSARRGDPHATSTVRLRSRGLPIVHHHAVVCTRIRQGQQYVLVQQRGEQKEGDARASHMWQGLWQAPTVESDSRLSDAQLRERLNIPVGTLRDVGTLKRQTSHRVVMMHVYTAATRVRTGRWVETQELNTVPMGNAQRRALELALDHEARRAGAAASSVPRSFDAAGASSDGRLVGYAMRL